MSRIIYLVWGLLLLFGAFVIRESLEHSYYGTDFGPGPGFFSFWLGILLMVLSLIQIVGTFRRPVEPLPDGFVPDRSGVKRMLYILAALVATQFLMDWLGFSLAMLAFCVFLFRMLGRQAWWVTVLLAVVGSFGMSYVFGLLQVMLPTGILGI